MLTVYAKTTTSFLNNGYGVLRDFLKNPQITEVINGEYTLEFEYAKDGWLSEYLVEENIIKANEQPFRIYIINKTIEKTKVLARHIAFDLNNNFLEDTAPTDQDGEGALQWILANTQYEHDFTGTSDVTTTASARYVRKNVFEALISADNSLINRWGGELSYDNYEITLNALRGEDRGLTIRYGKNLTGVDCKIDFSTVATRIMPQGNNGLLLPEKYIDSDLINTYSSPIVKKIEYNIGVTDEITEEQALDLLREAVASEYLKGIDLPKISVKVDFVELSKVKEYEVYSNLETAFIGDTVRFVIEPLNLTLTSRIIKTVYDCLLKRNIKLELGTVTPNFVNQTTNTIKTEIEVKGSNILEQAQASATSLIRQPFSGYTHFDNTGNFYIMDTNDISTALSVWKFGLGGIGYSATGINGTYEIAMTQDGAIVADMITAGTLNVGRIGGLTEITDNIQANIDLQKDRIDLVIPRIDSIEENGVTKVVNATVSVTDEGLLVTKTGEEMSTLVDNTGLYVYRDKDLDDETVLLTVNNQGVIAENVSVNTYLTIGDNTRAEDFDGGIGFFYIGS